jgi:hypothetical protein
MNDYENLRLSNIKRNQEYLDSLDIPKSFKENVEAKITKKRSNVVQLPSRKSKRISDLQDDEEEEPNFNENITKHDINKFNSPDELHEIPRCRVHATMLRNYISIQNSKHNDIISEMVVIKLC